MSLSYSYLKVRVKPVVSTVSFWATRAVAGIHEVAPARSGSSSHHLTAPPTVKPRHRRPPQALRLYRAVWRRLPQQGDHRGSEHFICEAYFIGKILWGVFFSPQLRWDWPPSSSRSGYGPEICYIWYITIFLVFLKSSARKFSIV